MSEEQHASSESEDLRNRLINSENFYKFLSGIDVHLKCPICSNESFNIESDNEGLDSAPSLFFMNLKQPSIFSIPSFYPIVIATCRKCAHIVPFSYMEIARWLEENNV